jgi:hypothetical protein
LAAAAATTVMAAPAIFKAPQRYQVGAAAILQIQAAQMLTVLQVVATQATVVVLADLPTVGQVVVVLAGILDVDQITASIHMPVVVVLADKTIHQLTELVQVVA